MAKGGLVLARGSVDGWEGLHVVSIRFPYFHDADSRMMFKAILAYIESNDCPGHYWYYWDEHDDSRAGNFIHLTIRFTDANTALACKMRWG